MTTKTKEEIYKEEARQAYKDQQSQDNEGGCGEPIGFIYGYLAGRKASEAEIENLKENFAFQKFEFIRLAHQLDEKEQTIQQQKEEIDALKKNSKGNKRNTFCIACLVLY